MSWLNDYAEECDLEDNQYDWIEVECGNGDEIDIDMSPSNWDCDEYWEWIEAANTYCSTWNRENIDDFDLYGLGCNESNELDEFDFESDGEQEAHENIEIEITALDEDWDMINDYDNEMILRFEKKDWNQWDECDDSIIEIDSSYFSQDESDLDDWEIEWEFDNGETIFDIEFFEEGQYRITAEDGNVSDSMIITIDDWAPTGNCTDEELLICLTAEDFDECVAECSWEEWDLAINYAEFIAINESLAKIKIEIENNSDIDMQISDIEHIIQLNANNVISELRYNMDWYGNPLSIVEAWDDLVLKADLDLNTSLDTEDELVFQDDSIIKFSVTSIQEDENMDNNTMIAHISWDIFEGSNKIATKQEIESSSKTLKRLKELLKR
jgi:hypothetical protein